MPIDLGAQSSRNKKHVLLCSKVLQNSSIYYNVMGCKGRKDSDQNGRFHSLEDPSPRESSGPSWPHRVPQYWTPLPLQETGEEKNKGLFEKQ